eukprot:44637-Hanusia_phi.AAC.1
MEPDGSCCAVNGSREGQEEGREGGDSGYERSLPEGCEGKNNKDEEENVCCLTGVSRWALLTRS